MPSRTSRARRVQRLPVSASLIGAVVLLGACGGAPPGPMPGGGAAAPTASPAAATARTYPGWPGDGPVVLGDIVPIIVSTDLAVGPNRFLMSLADANNRLIASPDLPVRLRFFDLAADPARPTVETEGRFQWTVEDELGLYVAPVDFRRAGDWGVEVVTGEGARERTVRVAFEVKEESSTPAIGARAPASETPTATDPAGVRRISTDPDPDPDFYRMSVEEAVASGKPSVVVFSTPAFCKTRTCGPALDIVKDVAGRFKGRVNFVHVEPYRLQAVSGQLQPEVGENGQFQVVRAVEEWNLPTEPYIFVIGPDGTVSAKFEGVAGREELERAIAKVAG